MDEMRRLHTVPSHIDDVISAGKTPSHLPLDDSFHPARNYQIRQVAV